MVKTDAASIVVDAGPLIHLDELDSLALLDDFPKLFTSQLILEEVLQHRPGFSKNLPASLQITPVALNLSPDLEVLTKSLSLDAGEISALLLMKNLNADLLLCDDAAARLAATTMGYRVHGTLGILIRSIRRGLQSKSKILELLQQLPKRSTLFIKTSLLNSVIEEVKNS